MRPFPASLTLERFARGRLAVFGVLQIIAAFRAATGESRGRPLLIGPLRNPFAGLMAQALLFPGRAAKRLA